MTRYSLFLFVVVGSAATAIAAISPAPRHNLQPDRNVTVIHMNQDFPYYGPVFVDECAVEDCSDE